MSRVFQVWPKRIKRSNGTVLTPEMAVTVTTQQHTATPFYNGAREVQNVLKVTLISMFCMCTVALSSCGHNDESKNNKANLQRLSTNFYSELSFRQRLDALLILSSNDTTKLCYALVMPKQTLIRLSKEETYPTSLAIEKTQEVYVKSIMTNCEYMDSLSQKDESKKDWLVHNSINEPINPIWEQIMEGKQ